MKADCSFERQQIYKQGEALKCGWGGDEFKGCQIVSFFFALSGSR